MKWLKRIALGLVATGALVIVSGIGYEQWSRWTVSREYPPPGQLVDVNGHKLHLNCSGVGGPTVILEHGITVYGSVSWAIVQPEIAKTNRVCSYDRSGYMWSDRRRPAPTGMENVADLHLALEIAGESPPYILVGHSYGGIVMRIFAARYPTEVDGLVFVDSSYPDQQERFGEEVPITPWWEPAYYWTLDHSGFTRIWQTESSDKVPSEAVFALEFSPQTMPGIGDEYSERSPTDQQARETGPFSDIPIIVLTARLSMGPSEEQSAELAAEEIEDWQKFGELWYQLHSELAALSTVNDHRIVEGSEHRIPFQAPESVVQAVRDAVAMSKQAGDGTEN